MDRTISKALYVILISIGLALVFNFLFFGKLVGISVFIFVVVLLGAVHLFGLSQKLPIKKTWWLVLLALFFALMPAIRASEFLSFLNIVATFGLLVLLAHQLVGTPAWVMRLYDYLVLAVVVPLRMLLAALSTVAMIGQIHSTVKHRDVWLRVIKGVIMALPILVIFGVLFSQADLAFSQFLKGIVDINISERTVQYTALLVLAFVASLSFLSYIFFHRPAQPEMRDEQPQVPMRSGKGIEVLVFLGLISTLFLVFIGFQVTYLFGGQANIVNAGFTYAEYARRGFFELLAVSILSLLVLLAAEKYAGVESKKDWRFLAPALILIAEVIVIMISAFKRLSLYIDAYGMTLLRFYVAAFILLLLVLFILIAVKFIKLKKEQFFTFATLLSGAAFLIAVNIINPDAFVIRANVKQYEQTGKVDVQYLEDLSADAASGKAELYNKLEGADKEILRAQLEKQKSFIQQNNNQWQSANMSRQRAEQILEKLEL